MKYRLFIVWLSFRWMFQTNLGDLVWYGGKKYVVANGIRPESWRLDGLENGNEGWVERAKVRKVISLSNLVGSFQSGSRFYTSNWLEIWRRDGIQDWMKALEIWPRSREKEGGK